MTDAQPSELERHFAEGEAALMLVESLMIALVEQRVLTRDKLTEAIETVISAKRQSSGDTEPPAISNAAVASLSRIANSISATPVFRAAPRP